MLDRAVVQVDQKAFVELIRCGIGFLQASPKRHGAAGSESGNRRPPFLVERRQQLIVQRDRTPRRQLQPAGDLGSGVGQRAVDPHILAARHRQDVQGNLERLLPRSDPRPDAAGKGIFHGRRIHRAARPGHAGARRPPRTRAWRPRSPRRWAEADPKARAALPAAIGRAFRRAAARG
jgi:hypothetical protein